MKWYINFLAWKKRIISLACFANNVIQPWIQVMPIFDREMPPGFTPAICLCRNFVYISILENRGDPLDKTLKILFWIVIPTFRRSCHWPKTVRLDFTASKTKAKLDPQTNFSQWRPPDLHADAGWEVALWRTAPGDAVLECSIENRCAKFSKAPRRNTQTWALNK